MSSQRDQWFAEFEQTGEDGVRQKVILGAYRIDRKLVAEAWLAQKEEARSKEAARISAASQSEQIDIARSAKDAAWDAAKAAREANDLAREANTAANTANRIAKTALIVAAVASAVAILSLFVNP